MSNRAILNGYRHALRATRVAFAGDTTMLRAARDRLHAGMRHVPPEQEHLTPKGRADFLEDVAVYLQRNIVQGKRSSSKDSAATYRLRIHSGTQVDDN